MIKIIFFIILLCVNRIQNRIIIYPNAEAPQYCSSNRDVDATKISVLQYNDTLFFLNGTGYTNIEYTAPIDIYLSSERAIRGQWVPGDLFVSFKNFCENMHKKDQPWGNLFRNFPACPIPKGSILKINMFKLDISKYTIPTNFLGRWRWIIKAKFSPKRTISFCIRFEGAFINVP